MTGPVSDEEIRLRSSLGYYLFMPTGLNERLLDRAGFECLEVVDQTDNMRDVAKRWYDARKVRADELRKIEGDTTYDGMQSLFDVTYRTAAERRLSRFSYRARRK